MSAEIDFPTVDEIVDACRAFVAKGGRVTPGIFGDGVKCGCPMTIMGRFSFRPSRETWAFATGFDCPDEELDEDYLTPIREIGAEVRCRLEDEGLMGAQ